MRLLEKKFELDKNEKYLKAVFGDESHFGDGVYKYKIGEINEASFWNPEDPVNTYGFNFSNESNIARWIVRGDTLYDVIIPEDSEVIAINNPSTPNGVFRTNKIIIVNPRQITDDLALELYKKSNMPEKTYFKTIAGYCVRGHINAAKQIVKDKVNIENIDLAIEEFNDFFKPRPGTPKKQGSPQASNAHNEVLQMLMEIKAKKENG